MGQGLLVLGVTVLGFNSLGSRIFKEAVRKLVCGFCPSISCGI